MAHPGSNWLARWTACFSFGALLSALPAAAQLGPVGDEFEVTTRTINSQNFPAISSSTDGFVVVWSNGNPTSPSPDGDRAGVFAQRHAADGSRRGTEFQINTYTTNNQRFPAVAASADGDFIAVWEGIGAGGAGVYGQRYDSTGAKQGTEFQVTAGAFSPRVARRADDSFVVVWWGGNDGGPPNPGGNLGVFAQRYDSAGAPVGTAFQVNTYTPNLQRNPAVAMTTGGAFVVVWQSDQDGGNDGIYAQRYSSDGAAAGAEFLVNTYTPGFQSNPAISSDGTGNFVVAWQSSDQDGSSYGVFAQRFDPSGARVGSEFQVNTYTPFDQSQPDVAVNGAGRFVITWGSTAQDNAGRDVFAQEFSATGARTGSEFAVNATTTGDQDLPVVAPLGSQEFVIAWDGGANGVLAQRFGQPTATVPPSPTPTPTVEGGGCPGDCDGSEVVQVNELVRCVNISLETAAVSTCEACDDDGDGRVVINELVRAVNSLLRQCP